MQGKILVDLNYWFLNILFNLWNKLTTTKKSYWWVVFPILFLIGVIIAIIAVSIIVSRKRRAAARRPMYPQPNVTFVPNQPINVSTSKEKRRKKPFKIFISISKAINFLLILCKYKSSNRKLSETNLKERERESKN